MIRIEYGNIHAQIMHMDPEKWPALWEDFLVDIPGAEHVVTVQLREIIRRHLLNHRLRSGQELRDMAYKEQRSNRFSENILKWYLNPLSVQAEKEDWSEADIRRALCDLDAARGQDKQTAMVTQDHLFPAGLLPDVVEKCESLGMQVELRGAGMDIGFASPHPCDVPLRPYQQEALDEALYNTWRETWWPRGVLQVATGGGKTEMAVAMYQKTRVPTMFLVHRKDLLKQAVARFAKYGIRAGEIGDGKWDFNPEGVTVATMQTLWSKYQDPANGLGTLFQGIRQVFFDEAHLMAADLDKGNIFVKIAALFTHAPMRWGLTATPFMRDNYSNRLLQGVTGKVLYRITNKTLIDQGYLTPPRVIMTTVNHPSAYEDPITGDENRCPPARPYHAIYKYAVTRNPARNMQIAKDIAACPKPALVLVQQTEHMKYLDWACSQIGIDIPLWLDGSSKTAERVEGVRMLREGDIQVLGATTIFDEGVDIPELRSVILAGGGKSKVKALQRLGRGLRLDEDKHEVCVYDYVDFNTDKPSWLPIKHSRERKKHYKDEGFTIETKGK